MAVKTELEKRIRTLLQAESDLDDVVAFATGALYLARISWFPLCEIVLMTKTPDDPRNKTGFDAFIHAGSIVFSEQYPDTFELVGRDIDVESQERVAVWADAAHLFLTKHFTLDDFISADGLEYVETLDVSVPEYAIVPSRAERRDNFESQAVVRVALKTLRRRV